MAKLYSRIGTLRQLEILLAVYKTGSITAASKSLFLTQPTVSMQLKKLSEAVAAPLYNQIGKKLVFTQAGTEVVGCAREMLEAAERLEMRLNELKGLKTGTLRLGVVTTAKYFIPHMLGDFLQLYPDIDIDFKVGNRQQIIERIGSGEDDFYVFSHPPDEWVLDLDVFQSNPLVAIAPAGHPLSERHNVPLADFMAEPFLMREEGSGTRHAIESHLASLEVKPNVRMVIESNEAIKHAVMSGLGVSVLSSHTLAFGGSNGLAILDVEHLPIETHWYLARLSGKTLSPVARTFMEYVSRNSA